MNLRIRLLFNSFDSFNLAPTHSKETWGWIAIDFVLSAAEDP